MAIIKSSLKRSFNKYIKTILTTLSILFYVGNYHICNYFYPLNDEESIDNWWILKMHIYALIMCLCYLVANMKKSTDKRIAFIEMFMLHFGIGTVISNFIDRRIFGEQFFSVHSLYMLIIIGFATYYNVKRLTNEAKKHAQNE